MDENVKKSIEQVCELLGDVTPEQIMGKNRTFKVATARQLLFWHLHNNLNMGWSDIGRAVGKHHATILYGTRQADIMIERNRTKEDRRIYNAAMALRARAPKRIEDRIADEINGADYVFDGERCSKQAEFDFGGISGSAFVLYDWHVSPTGDVADDPKEIEIECWDSTTQEEVRVDTIYIANRI